MSRGRRPLLLTIAGSDPSGGAGLQGDLKVFLRFGVSGAAVPTAVTVQSTSGVRSVNPLPAPLVAAQLAALLADVRPAAVKVGLLGRGATVEAVARALSPLARRGTPIVLDPVLAASSGLRLLPRSAVPALVRRLLPLATLVTPNLAEAAELAGLPVADVRRHPLETAQVLLQAGARAVLLKGGHLPGPRATDLLVTPGRATFLSLPRRHGRRRVHGTGCALASAIAALLARGRTLEQAVEGAKAWLAGAIAGAQRTGRGALQLDVLAPLDDGARVAGAGAAGAGAVSRRAGGRRTRRASASSPRRRTRRRPRGRPRAARA